MRHDNPLQHLDAVTKLRIIVADDEPLARAAAASRSCRKDISLEIVGEYGSGTEAIEAIRRDKPDIVFLDMQMPGCDGLAVVAGLAPAERPAVVFVTAHDKFAVDAFGVRAVDYVLKPFDRRAPGDGPREGGRVRERPPRRRPRRADRGRAGRHGARPSPKPERLAVKADGRFVFLKFDEIVWVEAADNYVVIHTQPGERLMPRDTLSSIEERLGPSSSPASTARPSFASTRSRSCSRTPRGTTASSFATACAFRSAAACAGDSRSS